MTMQLQNMKLGNQLRGSFTFLLVLLVIVAGFSIYGLTLSQTSFADYRALARDTNLAGRLQANLLLTRLGVVKYLNDDNSEILNDYYQRMEQVEGFFKDAEKEIIEPQRNKLLKQSIELTSQYKTHFAKVVELKSKRKGMIKDMLDPAGLAMRVAITQLIESAEQKQDHQALFYLTQLQESLLLGRLYVTKYLVNNHQADLHRAKQELEEKLHKYTQQYMQFVGVEEPQLSLFITNKSQYLAALIDIESLIKARNGLVDNKLNIIGPQVAQILEDIKLSVKAEQDKLGPLVQKNTEEMVLLVQLVSLVAVILGIAFAIFLPGLIRRPIGGEPREIALITERIAKGDLTQTFNNLETSTGIFKSVAHMSTGLNSVITRIIENGHSISDAAITSSQIAQNTNNAVSEQRERTSQIATAINEMSYSIQEVVKLSSGSATSANEAKQAAEKGLTVIDSTVSAINRLADTIENAMQDINKLEQSSHEIGAVVEVIKNISEQTNLLALNAAIEAARAGEQGRGFSVVADEVRNLAKRTQESTSEIQSMIEALQAGTNTAVSSMSTSSDEAHRAVDLSGQTRQQLDGILSMISNINDMNNQVAVAVEEQSTVCEDINQNITGIAESSDVSANSATEAATASENMAELANELQLIAKEFKVS